MSAEKVLSLYESDNMQNGWQSPTVDNKKMRMRELSMASNPALNPSRTNELIRSILDNPDPIEQARAGTGSDPRRGLELQNRLSASNAGKLTLNDSVKKKPAEVVNRLTAEQMAVLMEPSSASAANPDIARQTKEVGG